MATNVPRCACPWRRPLTPWWTPGPASSGGSSPTKSTCSSGTVKADRHEATLPRNYFMQPCCATISCNPAAQLFHATLLRNYFMQPCYATISCNPATQPTQCLTMTCKGCTASVAHQDCVAKLLRVCPCNKHQWVCISELINVSIWIFFLCIS